MEIKVIEMAQWLRAWTCFSRGPMFDSQHSCGSLQSSCNSSPRGSNTSPYVQAKPMSIKKYYEKVLVSEIKSIRLPWTLLLYFLTSSEEGELEPRKPRLYILHTHHLRTGEGLRFSEKPHHMRCPSPRRSLNNLIP